MQTQASSAKLVDTSVLMSTTTEVKTVPPEHTLLIMLNTLSVVDVSSPSTLLICSNVAKDVAADTTINKAADHAIETTNIVTVMEEIVYKDENKALKSDFIVDMMENAVYEAVGQSEVENDDGHAVESKL